jgi:hypothetical protein
MIMIRGVQCQYDGSSWRLSWDPVSAYFDSSAADTYGMVGFLISEYTLGMFTLSFLEE